MSRRRLPGGEYFGSNRREAPLVDKETDLLDALQHELDEEGGLIDEEEEDEKKRRAFEKLCKQRGLTLPQKEPSKEYLDALAELRALAPIDVKVQPATPAVYDPIALRQETLCAQLEAALERPMPPGNNELALLWQSAARPPWPPTTLARKGISLRILVAVVKKLYAVKGSVLVPLHGRKRVALLCDWLTEQGKHLLAIILEDSQRGEEVTAMKLLSTCPEEVVKDERWWVVGTTLAGMSLLQGLPTPLTKE